MKKPIQLTAFFLSAILLLTGCSHPQTTSQPGTEALHSTDAAAPDRHLAISLQPDKDALQVFFGKDLNGNFQHEMQYRKVKDVTITVNGETLPLETALTQGTINEEDIFCFARQDARAGVCETEVKSLRGVSNFYFHYPEYSLKLIYDILEAPDGEQYLISSMLLYARKIPGVPGRYEMEPDRHFYDAEARVYLDYEDWGLTFEVQQASPTGITVTCTQSGGQQIGDLVIQYYNLSDESGLPLPKAEGTIGAHFEPVPLAMGETSTITLDWTDWYGTLPNGTYYLEFDIDDLFDPEQVPPLMVDFFSRQLYPFSFTIAE